MSNDISPLDVHYLQLVETADSLMALQQWRQAEQTILEALKLQPASSTNMLLFSNLGIVRNNLDDIAGALEAFDIALARTPNATSILCNRAATLIADRQYDKAIADLSTALQTDSTLIWPRKMRATILLQQKNIENARCDFQFILNQDEYNFDALYGLAQCEMIDNNTTKALEYYNRAKEINITAELLFNRILALIASDKIADSRKETIAAINKYPDNAELYVLLAYVNKLLHLNEESDNALRIARNMGAGEKTISQFFGSSPAKSK